MDLWLKLCLHCKGVASLKRIHPQKSTLFYNFWIKYFDLRPMWWPPSTLWRLRTCADAARVIHSRVPGISKKLLGTSLCWWVKSALLKVGLTNHLKMVGKVPTSPYVPAALIQLNFWCSGQTFTSQKWIPVSNNLASHTRKILLPRCLNLNKTRSSCKLICSEYSSVDDLFRK